MNRAVPANLSASAAAGQGRHRGGGLRGQVAEVERGTRNAVLLGPGEEDLRAVVADVARHPWGIRPGRRGPDQTGLTVGAEHRGGDVGVAVPEEQGQPVVQLLGRGLAERAVEQDEATVAGGGGELGLGERRAVGTGGAGDELARGERGGGCGGERRREHRAREEHVAGLHGVRLPSMAGRGRVTHGAGGTTATSRNVPNPGGKVKVGRRGIHRCLPRAPGRLRQHMRRCVQSHGSATMGLDRRPSVERSAPVPVR